MLSLCSQAYYTIKNDPQDPPLRHLISTQDQDVSLLKVSTKEQEMEHSAGLAVGALC